MKTREVPAVEIEEGSVTPPPARRDHYTLEETFYYDESQSVHEVFRLDGLSTTRLANSITPNFLAYFVSLKEKSEIYLLLTKLANDQITLRLKQSSQLDLNMLRTLAVQIVLGQTSALALSSLKDEFEAMALQGRQTACEFSNQFVTVNRWAKKLADANPQDHAIAQLRSHIKTIATFLKKQYDDKFMLEVKRSAKPAAASSHSSAAFFQTNKVNQPAVPVDKPKPKAPVEKVTIENMGETILQPMIDNARKLEAQAEVVLKKVMAEPTLFKTTVQQTFKKEVKVKSKSKSCVIQ